MDALVTDLDDFRDKFLQQGDAQSTTAPWKEEAPQNTIDWSFCAINAGGGSLISPSFVVLALHVGDTALTFQTRGNVQVERTIVETWDIYLDLRIGRLNTPITSINPIAVLRDSSLLAGQLVLAVEDDRHLNVMTVAAEHSNAAPFTFLDPTTADVIEAGDSGKPAVALFGTRPVLAMTAFYSVAGGPNPSAWIHQINEILHTQDEKLTLLPDYVLGDSILDKDGNQISAGGQRLRLG